MSARPDAIGRGQEGGTPTVAVAHDVSEADRCLVAFAAHRLRGEITLQRTLAEVALADPRADTAALREMGERVVAATERQDRLLDALITLSRRECRRMSREPVDPR
jgi:signal transduction histidine kinase